jgi:GAF domain-containing protein
MNEYPEPLKRSLQTLTQFVLGDSTLGDTLDQVTRLAADAVIPAHLAAITLWSQGRPVTATYTSQMAEEIDAAQYQADSGPCVDAMRERRVKRLESTEEEMRWPEFSAAASAHGIRSVISFPLVVQDVGMGALNYYATEPHAFSGIDEEIGGVFADQASIVLANAAAYFEATDLGSQLQEALTSRDLIGQAKGLLMSAQGCSGEEAFEVLRRASQRENRRLRDIAAEMVERAEAHARRGGGPDAAPPDIAGLTEP